MHYGFIGAGNITSAIVTGVLRSGMVKPVQISVFDIDEAVLSAFAAKHGIHAAADAAALVQHSDIVLLAVKPNVCAQVLSPLQDVLAAQKVPLVSLAAGHTLQTLALFAGNIPIIRVMPNVNAAVCGSVNALCANTFVTAAQKESVTAFFNHTGATMDIEEKLFSAFSAIAGCSPAFTYLYINALAQGAHKNGMNKKQALQIAAQAVLGSAAALLESENEHPWALIDKVCSPGGTTIEGVCTLQDNRFESAVVQAVDSAVQKDQKM